MLVATHSSDQNPAPDHAFIQELAGPNISVAAQPIAVDNESGHGIDILRSIIVDQVQTLGQADQHWPQAYDNLSQALDTHPEPQISWSELTTTAQRFGLDANEAETTVIQLAVAGRLTYFKDAVLDGRVILEPDWLTAAISYVLKDQTTRANGGVITQQRLAELWTNPPPAADGSAALVEFKRSDVPFLIELMHHYGVAFRLPPPNDNALLVSQMIPPTRPPVDTLGIPSTPDHVLRRIRVELGTSASRPSLIPGLTSRAHYYTTGIWWQNGVAFHEPDHPAWALAELSPDRSALTLTLTVTGPRPEPLFSHLRGAIEDRLSEWPGLTPTYRVLCPVNTPTGPCNGSWLHHDLITKHEMNITTEVCTTCRNPDLPIAQLLGHLPTATIAATVNQHRHTLATRFGHDDLDTLLTALQTATETIVTEVQTSHTELDHALGTGFANAATDHYTQTRAVLEFLGQEIVDTPRLVSIHPPDEHPPTLNPRTWFNQTWHLRLWCEHPGHEHPVDTFWSFTRPRSWYEQAAPYLKWAALALRVTPLAGRALALGETLINDPTPTTSLPPPTNANGDPFTPDDLKTIRQGLQLTEALAKAATTSSDQAITPDQILDPDQPRHGPVDTRSNYNDPSLRHLRILLHDIGAMTNGVLTNSELRRTPPSPTGAWGTATSTTDGPQLWICAQHWYHYTSQT